MQGMAQKSTLHITIIYSAILNNLFLIYFISNMILKMIEFGMILVIMVNLAQSAHVTFNASLNGPDLDLKCKFKLSKGDKFVRLSLKRDGETFFYFDADNRDRKWNCCAIMSID